MLSDFTGAEKVYIACGYTDLRKGIDGLAALVQSQFQLDPFTNTLFLICGRRCVNIPPQTGQQNGGNRSRVTVEMSPGVRLQVQAVE